MIFIDESGEGVDVATSRRRFRAPLSPDRRRLLRDRAMLLLRRAGLSFGDIVEVAQAFLHEPVTDKSFVRRRILAAEQYATWEAAQAGLLSPN